MACYQLAYRHEGKAQGWFCCGPRAGWPTDHHSGSGTRVNSISRGDEVWLIGELRASGEQKYYLANLPAETDLRTLAATIKARWICEQAHQQLGLDHFEGRSAVAPERPDAVRVFRELQ
jgi:hypothetical protein